MDLLDRAFGGSAWELAMMVLCEESLAPEEKAEIKELLEKTHKAKKS